MTKASNIRKGKRNGSESNANSKASASDRKHQEQRLQEDKSIKLGTDQSGKTRERPNDKR
jgi:hypothetical protein